MFNVFPHQRKSNQRHTVISSHSGKTATTKKTKHTNTDEDVEKQELILYSSLKRLDLVYTHGNHRASKSESNDFKAYSALAQKLHGISLDILIFKISQKTNLHLKIAVEDTKEKIAIFNPSLSSLWPKGYNYLQNMFLPNSTNEFCNPDVRVIIHNSFRVIK
jgi:hypothetical protein